MQDFFFLELGQYLTYYLLLAHRNTSQLFFLLNFYFSPAVNQVILEVMLAV